MRIASWCGIGVGLFVLCTAAVACGQSAGAPVLVVPAKTVPLNIAVKLPDGFKADSAASWQLVEQGNTNLAVPVDLQAAITPDGTADAKLRQLVATIPPLDKASNDPRRFSLKPREAKDTTLPEFKLVDTSPASIQICVDDRPVLVYNHGQITNEKVPKKDRRRTRGCYIHPIYGLDGEVLTDDFPRDHYHHHGLFWAWPHVQIGEKAYDLWMGRGIRQRFVRWLGRHAGAEEATIGVENGWFVGKKQVMTERVWITVHKASDSAQAVDVALTLIPLGQPVTLWGADRKSYGGMTIRFAVPRKKRSTIIVPSGKSKKDLAMKRLDWADLTYPFGTEGTKPSGATLMISKTHPDYPPMWLTRHYGPLCVGYPGVDKKTFDADKPFTMRYRLWIHKGTPKLGQIKKAYDAYTSAESVRWE